MTVEVLSFGCRLNTLEGEALRGQAEAAGQDGLVVVNTCAVTTEAGRQARKAIRKVARTQPGARIVVTGCGAQVETAAYSGMPEVAAVLGNGEKLDAAAWLDPSGVRVGDIMAVRQASLPEVDGIRGRPRAFVAVQNGCDHRCTFCIIPFGRGNSRSVPASEVIAQVRRVVEYGAREVVLTGVDLTSYGSDHGEGLRLGGLLRRVLAAVPDLPRLRLSSIDSVEADADLMIALAEEERLMPHLHLSLQAGDDLVLKRMKRRHGRADAIRFCAEARRLRPDLVFGADLIAGFPTETEAMFARSLDLVAECGLTHLHVFPFSPRPGTSAARMPPVAEAVVRERAERLRNAGAAALATHLVRQVGSTQNVMAESPRRGRTRDYTAVSFARPATTGNLQDLAIVGHEDGRLLAA